MEAHHHANASPRPFSVLLAQLEELDDFFSSLGGPESTEGQDALLMETLMSGFTTKTPLFILYTWRTISARHLPFPSRMKLMT
jgi:hypothetical protein